MKTPSPKKQPTPKPDAKQSYLTRIQKLRSLIAQGLLEKEEAVAMTLLCLLAGKSIFLYGPPGTAKSLIARRVSCAFKSHQFFDYLMHRFSTPEDLFGPLKLSQLRLDKLERNTQGFLPTADFAFLDEIWKSGPAILNALLTLINERKFRNGDQNLSVPLKGLVAASNELPQKDQGLEALYDRFIVRLGVGRLASKENFQTLLKTPSAPEEIDIPEELCFSNEELTRIREEASQVELDDSVINMLTLLRDHLSAHNAQSKDQDFIDVSERRWVAIMELLRVAAFLSDRSKVVLADLALLKHCLWSQEGQEEVVKKMLEESFKTFSPQVVYDESVYTDLKKEIALTLTHSQDVHEITTINQEEFVPFNVEVLDRRGQPTKVTLYAKACHIRDGKTYRCWQYDGGNLYEINQMRYCFDPKKDQCAFSIDVNVRNYGWDSGYRAGRYEPYNTYQIPLKFKKGTPKPITKITQKALLQEIQELKDSLKAQQAKLEQKIQEFQEANAFLDAHDQEICLKALQEARENFRQLLINTDKMQHEVQNAPLQS